MSGALLRTTWQGTHHARTQREGKKVMYMHEMLVREHQSERLRQAHEARLARHAAELSRLRQVQQRAERRLRRVEERAGEVRSAISAVS